MDRAILSQRITSIISDLNRLTNTLYSLNMTDIQRRITRCFPSTRRTARRWLPAVCGT